RGFGPENPAYGVLYLIDGEGLFDDIVRDFVRELVRELLLGPRAYNYDVRVMVDGLYFPQKLEPVLARHREVQEQEVEMVLLQKVEGFLSAPGRDDVMPGGGEAFFYDIPYEFLVVYYEHVALSPEL